MAWDVNQIYGFTKFLTRKNQAGGISAGDLFFAWNAEQTAFQQDLLGRWQNRNNGKSGIETGLIENETIMTKLAPFITPTTLTVTAGQATKPAGFIYTISLRINNAQVFQVYPDQLASVYENVIDPPSVAEDVYYYTEYLDYFFILPNTVTSLNLDYIKVARDIVWAWTPDANGRQLYDAANSVQPQWDNLSVVEITKRTLKGFGVSFSSQDFEQYGNSNIATGN